MNNRWWIYQKERFPLAAHGVMVGVFAGSVLLYSSLADGELPDPWRLLGAAVSALLLFFQLRVADEYKDRDIDARYRPERPVPRGLVRLPELARLAWIAAAVQFAIAVAVDVGLVPILVIVWLYMGLMTREFFVHDWLVARPVAYLLSHMLVMPLIAFYVSAFDWLCLCREMPAGLGHVLAFSFFCGLSLEIGRKIRAPQDEQPGVETYSGVWGQRRAGAVWALSVVASVIAWLGTFAGNPLHAGIAVTGGLGIVAALLLAAALRSRYRIRASRLFEPVSGLVAMLLYAGLGLLQLA